MIERSLTTVYRYSRAELLRILRLTARQLAAREKAELVAAAESYSFFDLLQIKKIRDLCARKVCPAVIRRSLDAMQKQAAGMKTRCLKRARSALGIGLRSATEAGCLSRLPGSSCLTSLRARKWCLAIEP